jgi:hypothetical protein
MQLEYRVRGAELSDLHKIVAFYRAVAARSAESQGKSMMSPKGMSETSSKGVMRQVLFLQLKILQILKPLLRKFIPAARVYEFFHIFSATLQ